MRNNLVAVINAKGIITKNLIDKYLVGNHSGLHIDMVDIFESGNPLLYLFDFSAIVCLEKDLSVIEDLFEENQIFGLGVPVFYFTNASCNEMKISTGKKSRAITLCPAPTPEKLLKSKSIEIIDTTAPVYIIKHGRIDLDDPSAGDCATEVGYDISIGETGDEAGFVTVEDISSYQASDSMYIQQYRSECPYSPVYTGDHTKLKGILSDGIGYFVPLPKDKFMSLRRSWARALGSAIEETKEQVNVPLEEAQGWEPIRE